ncbi:uncharacterized protein LOC124887097 [Capsicum annuum]|uniref:uncharacterized protein LOC124887097 n=1 Tax=Capsicum annuum TaxID=4072 RepID=UPI001FB1433D|nr:uncharacterized protein LOC124887097 [Capsicum annuum]
MVTSHSASIKQLETQLGQISAQLNARPNGRLPSDMVVNPKNDAHVLAIIIRSGRILGKDIIDLGEDPNEKSNKEKGNPKKKLLEEPIDNNPKPNETSIDDQRLKKKDDDIKFKKFFAKFINLSMNIPLLESLQEMPRYVKFMKDLVTKKRVMNFETVEVTHNYSAIMSSTVVAKKEDPRAFTIPCTIGMYKFGKALCDLGESINLMPFSMFQKLGLGSLNPTTMRLLMADRSIKKFIGVLYDVLVKVDRFIFPANFVILDCEIDHEVPKTLGRTFIATRRALVDVECGDIKFRVNNEEVFFNVCKSMK